MIIVGSFRPYKLKANNFGVRTPKLNLAPGSYRLSTWRLFCRRAAMLRAEKTLGTRLPKARTGSREPCRHRHVARIAAILNRKSDWTMMISNFFGDFVLISVWWLFLLLLSVQFIINSRDEHGIQNRWLFIYHVIYHDAKKIGKPFLYKYIFCHFNVTRSHH